MNRNDFHISSQRGTVTLEFTFCAATLFMLLVGIVGGGNLFWTHNALVDATRRGARYATLQCNPSSGSATNACPNAGTADARIKNIVVYGTDNPPTGATPLVTNLQTTNVTVARATDPSAPNPPYGVSKGIVTVSITNYQYNFVIPGVSRTITLPHYETILSGESAGYVPADQ